MNVVQAWNVSTVKARLVLLTTMFIIPIIILMINVVVVVVDVVEVQMMISCGQR